MPEAPDSVPIVVSGSERSGALASLTESLARGMIVVGRDLRIEYVSAAAAALLGIARDRLTASRYDEVGWRYLDARGRPLRLEDLPVVRVLATGQPVRDFDHVLAFPDGRELALSATCLPLYDEDGIVAAVCLGLCDSVERRRRKASGEAFAGEAEDQRRLLASIVEHAPVGMLVVDGGELRVRWANPAHLQFLDYPRPVANPVGLLLEDYLPRGAQAGMLSILRRVAATALPTTFAEQPMPGEGGRVRYVDATVVPLPAAGDGPADLLILVLDVTEKVEARIEIEQLAAEASRTVGELNAVFDALNEVVVVYDANAAPIRANKAAVEAFGFDPVGQTREEYLRRLGVRHDNGRPVAEDELASARALRGERVVGEQTFFRDVNGREAHVAVSGSPLYVDGRIAGAVTVWHDITRRKDAERERARAQAELGEADQQIAAIMRVVDIPVGSVPLDDLLRSILNRLTEVLRADGAVVLLREGEQLRLRAAVRRRVGVDRDFAVRVGEGFAGTIAATRHPLYVSGQDVDEATASPYRRERGVEAMLGVPLVHADDLIGVLHVDWLEPHALRDRELRVLEVVADRCALSFVNAQLYEAEHRVAETLQASLKRPLPTIPGLEIGVGYRPAEEAERVGGDFFDVFPVGDQLVVVLVGDVSGKGVEAAGLTETVRSSARTLAYIDPSPAFVLSRLNRSMREQMAEDHFVTLAYVVVNPATGEAVFANAGHPTPVVVDGGRSAFIPAFPGMPLGTFDSSYPESAFRLGPGDVVALYTDGLLEARRGRRMFGDKRLFATLRANRGAAPAELAAALIAAVDRFSTAHLRDDIAVVAFRLATAG